jgi:hypothetical protein
MDSNFAAVIQPGITYDWNLSINKTGSGTGSGSISVSEVP